jgi:TolB protein
LTANVDARGAPEWSPDGQWIVVGGIQDGVSGLYKLPAGGGAAQLIVGGQALNPVWSPAGDLIFFAGAQVGPTATLRAVRPDGVTVEIPEILVLHNGERMRFLPDGSGLVYMKGLRSVQDFWLLDIDTMKDRQLTQLDAGATMRTFDITPDASKIVFDRLIEDSDIVLIERDIKD